MATAVPSTKGAACAATPVTLSTLSVEKMERGEGMGLSLHGRWRATLFLLAVFIPGVWFLALVARVGLAATWGASLQIATLQRALTVDAANPELHFNLGTAYLWVEGGNPSAAVRELSQAIHLNPNVAAYWSALGKACYAAGQADCADRGFEQAAQIAPAKPRYAWEAALHYTVTGRPEPAWPHFRRLLQLQPDHAFQVFALLDMGRQDPDTVWHQVVSSAPLNVRLAFLGFLATPSHFPESKKYWTELSSTKLRLPREPVASYVEQLLRGGYYSTAAEVWMYWRKTEGIVPIPISETNLAFNGSFESVPLQAGFDWHFQQQRYLEFDFADRGAHGGQRALRLDFTVPNNAEYEPAYEFIPVSPGQSYILSAYVRSEHITSDSGPRLRVSDPQCAACLSVETPDTVGTVGWRRVAVQFTAPQTAQLLRLSLWRPRSRSFPMDISGQFWLDDVVLHSTPAVVTQAARGDQPR